MTGKDRILTTLRNGHADRVPFVPNIWQWFYVNQLRKSLPPCLAAAKHPVEALRMMGADILSKFEGKVQTPVYRDCEYQSESDGQDLGQERVWASFLWFDGKSLKRETLKTPAGTLTHLWEYQSEAGAPFEREHWWKNWDEYPVVRSWLENTDFYPDLPVLENGLGLIGEDGIVLFQLLETPLKKFHWLAGQEAAAYFICDHPREMAELARIYERKSIEYLARVIDLPKVTVFEIPDNVDTLFYPPAWFREFCAPVLKQQADLVHAKGKYLFLHACGRLKALGPQFVESGVDCLEGHAPPPLGDWGFSEARALSDRLILCGGMTAIEQEISGPNAVQVIDSHVRDLFSSIPGRRRFLFGSSCNTSPRTSYDNLLAFRDSSWKHGGF